MKRLFVAIEVPKKLREKIFADLSEPLLNVNKTIANNLHITLCFIGDVSEQGEVEIVKRLEKIEFSEFNVLIGRVGQFDERVLWVSAEALELHNLADQISKTLHVDNEFNGHITIARTTQGADFDKEFAKIRNKRINQTIKVKSFVLLESKASPTGSVYSKVSEFKVIKKTKENKTKQSETKDSKTKK